MGLTHDAMPAVDSPDERIISWSGCNGRGLALSTLMGRTLTDRLLGNDSLRLPFPTSRYWHKGGVLGWLAQTFIAVDRCKQRRRALALVNPPSLPGEPS
ncbi:hypothetical protein D3C71_1959040 [compost metagenome]